MTNALLLKASDSVAVVTAAVSRDEEVAFRPDGAERSVIARDDIPVYHKIAVKAVKKDGTVLKYGEVIGYATADIEPGDHVHIHNLSDRAVREEAHDDV